MATNTTTTTTSSFLNPVGSAANASASTIPQVSLPTLNFGAQTPARTPFFQPTAITQQQYLAGPVDFYSETLGTGIEADEGQEEEDQQEEQEQTPNIFEPVGGGDDQPRSALQHTLGGGLQPSYGDVKMYDVNDINFDQMSFTPDMTGSAFENLAKNTWSGLSAAGKQTTDMIKQGNVVEGLFGTRTAKGPYGTATRAVALPGAITSMLGVMGAGPIGAIAAIAGAANMAIQAQNAAAYKATGGIAGALMDVNNAMISRPPGSLIYSGNMSGLSNEQMAAIEAQKRGFVPGTMKAEVFDKATGVWTVATGTKSMMDSDTMSKVGGTYNPETGTFVDSFGNTSATGTKSAAKALADTFNNKLGSTMSWGDVASIRSTINTNIFGNVTSGPTFQEAYTEAAIKSAMENTGLSRSQIQSVVDDGNFIVRSGTYDKEGNFTPGSSVGTNSKGYSTFADFRGSSEEEDDAPDTGPSTPSAPASAPPSYSDPYDSGYGSDNNNDGPGSSSSGGSMDSGDFGDSFNDGDFWARGGRVGFAPGGEAGFAQRPEFVGGKQSQPDGVSVADDQPRDVQEGTFVINAAAADFAGRGDIEKMLRDAYAKVGDIGQTGVGQEVAINVSKGEVTVPPHIAKEIGYDKLNKINNRGKKEIARRQEKVEAAGGGFIQRKKFADGGGVDNLYTGPLPQPIGSDIVDERIRQFGPTGYGLLDEDQIRLEEQTRINPSAPPMGSEADKQAYRKGVEFGDTEVGFGMLGKTNYNKVLLAGLRDTRTLSDFVKTLGIDEDISGYFGSKPAGAFRSTSNRVLVKNPEFFAQPSGKGMSLSYGAVLAHELMHKGADALANDPNFKPSETLVKAQRAWRANEESRKNKVGGNTPEHRYIQSVINEAYMLRDVDSVLGKLQRQEKTGEPVRDLELYYDENNNPKFETIFRQVNKSDIAQAKTRGILREMRRSYNSYLTDENKKQFLEENKEYVYDKYGTISMKDSDVPFTTAAGIFRSLNRIMAQDYATKLFESAIADKPIEVQRKPDRKPEPQLAPEPKYERGFLEKALGISPAY